MSLHTVFCAECSTYFDWKSAGVYHSHRAAKMDGNITRLLACSPKQLEEYPARGLTMGQTFIHPNYANPNPHNGESSGSYNKPASVMHFTQEAAFDEEYILFIDADMLLRAPIDPLAMGARRGVVVSETVPYLYTGIDNGLPEQFLPRNATGPRRGAGWYHIFHRDDLKALAPRWLYWCEQIRSNPQRYWNLDGHSRDIPTGDSYVKRGEAPWISEMYGYVLAAAELGIETKLTRGFVQYSDHRSAAPPPRGPSIIHYGLHCHVNDYHFTKYDYGSFDVARCGGHFFWRPERPQPPQALCAETIMTLNNALCSFYRDHCGMAPATLRCPSGFESKPHCVDSGPNCEALKREGACGTAAGRKCVRTCTECCGDASLDCRGWAVQGECDTNRGFMRTSCALSCDQCAAGAVEAAVAPLSSSMGVVESVLLLPLSSPPPPPPEHVELLGREQIPLGASESNAATKRRAVGRVDEGTHGEEVLLLVGMIPAIVGILFSLWVLLTRPRRARRVIAAATPSSGRPRACHWAKAAQSV